MVISLFADRAQNLAQPQASFCAWIFRGYLHASSDAAAQASSLIRSYSDVKASTVTGVTGVTVVSGTLFWVDIAATSVLVLCFADGFGISRSTLFGLEGNDSAILFASYR
jgi:hypothetical protein